MGSRNFGVKCNVNQLSKVAFEPLTRVKFKPYLAGSKNDLKPDPKFID